MWVSGHSTMNNSLFFDFSSIQSSSNHHMDTTSSSSSSSSLSPIFESFCEQLQTIGGTYNVAHGYASLTVCCFGTVANILNLIILTRKEMVNSTNIILTGLALADLLTTVEYVPYAIYTDFLPDPVNGGRRKTWAWALYVLIHSNFSQVCHTIAIWLTVTVAAWRYFMISTPLQCKTLCSMERAKWMLVLAYLISPLLCIPIYLAFSIRTVAPSDPGIEPPNVAVILHHYTENMTLFTPTPPEDFKYIVNLSDLARRHKIIVTINFWVYSVVIKIIPCILLTVVSVRLISSLMKVSKRKKLLLLGQSSSARSRQASSTRTQPGGNTEQPANSCPQSASLVVPDQISNTATLTASPQQPDHHPQPELSSHAPIAETSFTVQILPEIEESRHHHLSAATSSPRSRGGGGGGSVRIVPSGEVCLTKRTTTMLLTVLVLFLITEFPQGVLALFSDLMGDDFFKRCYIPMANLMDFLALFNAALNFILYFASSIRFRNTFIKLVKSTRAWCCAMCW